MLKMYTHISKFLEYSRFYVSLFDTKVRANAWFVIFQLNLGVELQYVYHHYVNVSVLKVFTKDQCFGLNYHKFSIKSYVVDVY